MLVREAFSSGKIDNYYKQFMDEKCECGGDMDISESLARYRCTNNRCFNVLTEMGANMYTKLGIVGAAEGTILKIYKKVPGTRTPFQLLVGKFTSYDINVQVKKALSRPVTFREAVRILSLPNFDKKALKIFDKIESPEHWNYVIQRSMGLENWLLNRVGFAGATYYNVLDVLTEFKPEIDKLGYIFNLKKQSKNDIMIVITDDLRGFASKDDFVKHLNELGEGIYEFTHNKCLESAPYIIADTDRPTRSYRTARRREDHTGKKVLYRSWEFIELLKEDLKISGE